MSHEGTAASGQEIEKRRLRFDTEVTVEGRTISRGTHQRAIIDTKRFGQDPAAGAQAGLRYLWSSDPLSP